MKHLRVLKVLAFICLLTMGWIGFQINAATCSASATNCNASCSATGATVSCTSGANFVHCKAYNAAGVLISNTRCRCFGPLIACTI